MVSEPPREHRKVVLGGQGGDEIFGGYARYLIAYFEQCIKAAIDGTTAQRQLRRHLRVDHAQPRHAAASTSRCCRSSGATGCSTTWTAATSGWSTARRRSRDEIDWDQLGTYSPFETFRSIFHADNVGKESYFDRMTHFDFKTLLPALLQVEDRMSMAHGLESRRAVPRPPLVELAATIPADIKFKDGRLKHVC